MGSLSLLSYALFPIFTYRISVASDHVASRPSHIRSFRATSSLLLSLPAKDASVHSKGFGLYMLSMIEKLFGRRTKLMFDPGLLPLPHTFMRFPFCLGMIQIQPISPTSAADSAAIQTT
jgi:hypothetical protein